jgi:predicted aspartyl protease
LGPLRLSAQLRINSVALWNPREVIVIDDMGCFRTAVEIENAAKPGARSVLRDVLVDTGSELSWFPLDVLEALGIQRQRLAHFRQATGTIVTRWTGFAVMHVAETVTVDQVVFGETGDMMLLGARTLEGLNLCVDPVRKRLIDAGPVPAAAA